MHKVLLQVQQVKYLIIILELLFKGVNLRSFPYSITFSPRNPKEESDVVKRIIRAFKMQSMAAKAGELMEVLKVFS